MFVKNRNKTVGLCVMVVTACLILAGLWAVLAAPETALAKKPGGGGGKGGGGKKQEIQVSVTFRDDVGDGVQSDWDTAEERGDNPYTRITGKNKVDSFIGLGGQLRLMTDMSDVRSILLNIPIQDFVHGDGANLLTLGEDIGGGVLTPEGLEGDIGHRLNLMEMDPGSSTNAGLRIRFPDDSGDIWYVRFGDVGDDQDPPQPRTNLVLVTAGADTDGNGKPNSWTIEAVYEEEGDGDKAVAAVLPHDGETQPTFVSMPFQITVEILP